MAESENFYQNIFASLVDGVLVISGDLKITKVNQGAEEIFQRSRSSLEGEHLAKLFPNQTNITEKAYQSITTEIPYHNVEGIGYRKSGNESFPTNLTFSPLIKSGHKVTTGIILVKDISLLKELQENSQQTEYLSTLSILTAGMAHEIRNPLSGIRGSAQLLLKDLENIEQREYIEIVIAEVDRINRLVKRMMDLTRPVLKNFKPTNIHQVLEEILALEKELGKVILEQDEMVNAVKPNLEAEYQKKIGYKELECLENEIAARRLKRQIELIQAVVNRQEMRKTGWLCTGAQISGCELRLLFLHCSQNFLNFISTRDSWLLM